MTASFRRRLLFIAALTVIVCGAAVVAVLVSARMTLDERVAHARDLVTREALHIRDEVTRGALVPIPSEPSGQLRIGFLPKGGSPDPNPLVNEAAGRAAAAQNLTLMDGSEADGTPVIVASVATSSGTAFAVQRVVTRRETRELRLVLLVFAAFSVGLVVFSLQTMRAVDRDVSTLRSSLAALANDLESPIPAPALRELSEVSCGIEALASELARAQEERERLTRELGDRERLAALGRVAAGIAHEVRNPLAAMKLRADLALATGAPSPSIAADLEAISSEIERLDRLVNDLLVLAGKRAPERDRESVELGTLVAKRLELLAPWANERNVDLRSRGDARASAHPDAIARAVDNLVRNAVEASPPGSRVEVSVAADGARARIDVVDSGAGVSAASEDALFEPFFTTKPDGTGLGLALARAVATAHNGTVGYERSGPLTRFVMEISQS